MKSAGFHLLYFIAAGSLAAQSVPSTEPAPPAKTSARLTQDIRSALPKYSPPPATPPAEGTAAPAPEPDPNVLVLPTVTVQEKRLPSDAADHLMSQRDFDRKMENIYLDTIAADGPLNAFLNSHALPILNKISIPLPPRRGEALYRSVENERGRDIYRARELERLEHVTEIGRTLDPEAARKFKQETDNTHTTRPAGK